MKTKLLFIIKYSLFWLAYFFLARAVFLLYNFRKTSEIESEHEIWQVFLFGLKMDASVTGYFLLLPVLVLIFGSFFKGNIFPPFIKFYTFFLLFLTTILVATDLRIFRHWGYRLDVSPFLYLKNPGEAVSFISFAELAIGVPGILIMTAAGFFTFKKLIRPEKIRHIRSWLLTPVIFLSIGVLLIIPIRGGVGLSPLNESSVYFSLDQYCNLATLNVFWNVADSITEMDEDESSYVHMPIGMALSKTEKLYPEANHTRKVINSSRPNIVLIIMESMTRKMLYAYRDSLVITPHLNNYGKEGIYFSNFYGSGERTDKGLVAILSGYPALAQNSILSSTRKVSVLPTLFHTLGEAGYETSFYYGGDANFANIKSYIIHGAPDILIDKYDFSIKNYNAKWGVHDHVLFEHVYENIQSASKPFFKAILTLSNHEPFDVPQSYIFKARDPESLFANSANYADYAIFEFIECLRQTPEWDNTLVILVADHSTTMPYWSSHYELARFKIPMIWLGGVLKSEGKEISRFGDQTDIPVTLLKQLNLSTEEYIFGKDLFARKAPSFAYYAFNKGFGFVSDSLTLIYDNKQQNYLVKDIQGGPFEEDIGKAHQQVVFRDYLEK